MFVKINTMYCDDCFMLDVKLIFVIDEKHPAYTVATS